VTTGDSIECLYTSSLGGYVNCSVSSACDVVFPLYKICLDGYNWVHDSSLPGSCESW
jgi:hypothetical protein